MPGGQYTNLREQARSLGIDDARTEIGFPESVRQFFRGELGQPHGGFPQALQRKVLNGAVPLTVRPGAVLPPIDLEAERERIQPLWPRRVTDHDLASYLMYPRAWLDYARDRIRYGDVGILPTAMFFYGMEPGQVITVELERGKTLIVRYVTTSDAHEDGTRTVFFELNGEPRSVRVSDRTRAAAAKPRSKADHSNCDHVAAPMRGIIVSILVSPGQRVERGEVLVTLEAMKIEAAVRAEFGGEVAEVLARPGTPVEAGDLLMVMKSRAEPSEHGPGATQAHASSR